MIFLLAWTASPELAGHVDTQPSAPDGTAFIVATPQRCAVGCELRESGSSARIRR
ncbi:MAG: hypothetical protein GY913_09725 [Proteobacteria bacterium]|nr:hypothetical protein [Pseudomonadota bacterium]MCP4917190.1 hypothetical protein [Pseudomonadota bacterium]